MASSQLNAFYSSQSRAVRDPEIKRPGHRIGHRSLGPVHRPGPTWHNRAILQAEDPAALLLARPLPMHVRLRRRMRMAALLAVSFALTPILPALLT